MVCMGCLCPLSCVVSVPHSHFFSLQDEVAMEPLSIPVVLVILSSFLVSQWIFHVACPWLSERLIPAFLTLTHMQRTEWSSRSIFFFLLLICLLSYVCCKNVYLCRAILFYVYVSLFMLYYKMQALCIPNRAVSTVHALVVGLFCLYILLFDEAIKKDPIW